MFYQWTYQQRKPLGTKAALLRLCAAPTTQTSQCRLSPLGVAEPAHPGIGTALRALLHGGNKVILAPVADAVSEGPAELTAHPGPA